MTFDPMSQSRVDLCGPGKFYLPSFSGQVRASFSSKTRVSTLFYWKAKFIYYPGVRMEA